MTKKKAEAKAAPWGERPVVVLRAGPRGGWWYFADEMAARRAGAEAMGRRWPYVETRDTLPHPEYPAVRGAVLEFSGAEQADDA